MNINDVLDALQSHIKSLHNEALRRQDLPSYKQSEGGSFADYYVLYC